MQIILITGVNDGIGHALAIQYAASGARVLGVGRSALPESLAGSVHSDDYCAADLGEAGAAQKVQSFLDARGVTGLDVIIHNAAVGWYGAVQNQSSASIRELLSVNLSAPITLTHALLPRVCAARGAIAFVSSVHSVLPTPDFAVYTATKAALDGFARNLRLEVGNAVDVLVFWPGPTRTQMHVKSGIPKEKIYPERYASPEAVAAQIITGIRRRRSQALGPINQVLRWCASHFEFLVDTAMVTVARRARYEKSRRPL
ncbi:MAG: SDR family NAD(P)-dependent oxidoreductase [Anaerolineales bacterium]|nr:SDR family NAD(P)-dependent oxidoreductase [Anaerolineales bacterium]